MGICILYSITKVDTHRFSVVTERWESSTQQKLDVIPQEDKIQSTSAHISYSQAIKNYYTTGANIIIK